MKITEAIKRHATVWVWKHIPDLSPSCKRAAFLQSLALDSKLTPIQRLGLRIHLRLCKWCRRYGEQIAFLRPVAGRCEHEDHDLPTRPLSTEARERIKQRLKRRPEN